jgi:hypothetical protein
MRYGLFDDIEDLIHELDTGGNCLINALIKINDENDYFETEELLSYIPSDWHQVDVSRNELREGARSIPDTTIILRELTFPKGPGGPRKMVKKVYGDPAGTKKFDIALYAGHYFVYDYPCRLTKEYIVKKQYMPSAHGGAYMHTPMTGQAVSSLILLSVIEDDQACKVKWSVEELMKVGTRSTEDEVVTRLDLSPASVYNMCAHIHHNHTSKNEWEVIKIKRRQKGLYQEMDGIKMEWNVEEGFSSAVGNVVRIGLDGTKLPGEKEEPPLELDATAFEWEGFGPNRKRLPKVMYADFETTKKMDDKYQVPYCMVLIEQFNARQKLYWGEDCAVRFLEDLEEWFEEGDNVIVYYHNLGFDEKYLFQKGLKIDKIITTSAARTIVVYCTLSSGAKKMKNIIQYFTTIRNSFIL